MRTASKVLGAIFLVAAIAGHASAGEPGKTTLKPLYDHSKTKIEYKKQTSTNTYNYSTTQSDQLNLQEYKRLKNAPSPNTVVYYTTTTTTYQPQETQKHYVYTEPKTVVTCGDYYKYQHATAGCVLPSPPPPPPQPEVKGCVHTNNVKHDCSDHHHAHNKPPVYMKVESCGDKVIRRLSNTPSGERQYSVCYSDLNHLPEFKRNMALLDRMEQASVKACRDVSMTLYSLRAKTNCKNDTLANAVYEAKVPGLVDAYYVRTGKVRPKVHVGQPIMN